MSEMEFRGVTLELDLLDADNMEKFETALRETGEKVADKSQYDGKTNSEQMRIQIGHVDGFFDTVFGEGTADSLFGGSANLRDRIEAFGLAAQMTEQVTNETKELMGRYSPSRLEGNREQRRKQKYNNRSNHKWN